MTNNQESVVKDVRETLSRLWLDALTDSTEGRVEGHERFFESGGDSFRAIKLFMEMEEKLGVSVDPTEFMGALAEDDFDGLVRLVGAPDREG